MELRQLKYFVKAAETLNFSDAAKVLNITQSTLSQQIKQLEGELGTQLFTRSSHNVCLTEAGLEMLPYAKETINSADLVITRIRDLNKMHVGTLNIGVTYSFSPILTETLISFRKQYPEVKLNIFYRPMEELMDLLREREVDFVLAFKPTRQLAEIESHILFQNYLAAIVREDHPLAKREKLDLSELDKYDLAMPAKGLQARNSFDSIKMNTKNLKIKLELNEVNILLKIIRQTSLVTVLAEASIHNESGVKAIRLDYPGNQMDGCIHTLKDGYHKQSMREFIKLLSESLAVKERQNSWI